MRNKYSLFITSTSGSANQITFTKTQLTGILFLVIVLVFMAISSIYFGLFYVKHYSYINDITNSEGTKTNVIKNLEFEINSLRKMVELMIEKEEKIRQDLGEPKYRKLSKRRLIQRKQRAFVNKYPQQFSPEFILHSMSYDVSYIKTHVLLLESRMRNHFRRFNQYLDWFDSTPSIYPVYGHIQSAYGWRFHPLKKSRQFHKGIDVPAWIGAPVQATADGFVQFAGWAGGYGWMIVLSHDFGYQTLYAHLSEIQTLQGNYVNKGEIIGKIGSSGLSTGPHVHYEVRHRKKSVDPNIYLKLDLFTAVSKLW